MPLPHFAFEGGFGIELELVNDVFPKQLSQWLDQAWMPRQQAKYLTESMGGKGRARCPSLLAPHFLAVELEDILGLCTQQRDLVLGETIGEKNVAPLVEGLQLLGGKSHSASPSSHAPRFRGLLRQSIGGKVCGLAAAGVEIWGLRRGRFRRSTAH